MVNQSLESKVYNKIEVPILKTRSASLFRFSDYLSPSGTSSVDGNIKNLSGDIVCGAIFPVKGNTVTYNNGFIQSLKSLAPGQYYIEVSWIEIEV